MKVNKALLIVVILVTLLLGILLGYYIRGSQSGGPIDLNPIAKSCQYGGKTYKSGEGFTADDGCNSCTCIDGNVGCTLMACE